MTLAHRFEIMMKIQYKIALLLIVFVLGIISYPQALATMNITDTVQLQDTPPKKQKFSGFVIDASPADRLLYQQQTEIINEIHAQFVSSSEDNRPDTGNTALDNIHSKNCSKAKINCPSIVACKPECNRKQTKPKK